MDFDFENIVERAAEESARNYAAEVEQFNKYVDESAAHQRKFAEDMEKVNKLAVKLDAEKRSWELERDIEKATTDVSRQHGVDVDGIEKGFKQMLKDIFG